MKQRNHDNYDFFHPQNEITMYETIKCKNILEQK